MFSIINEPNNHTNFYQNTGKIEKYCDKSYSYINILNTSVKTSVIILIITHLKIKHAVFKYKTRVFNEP